MYGTVTDVEVEFGDIPDSTSTKVDSLLERAEAMVRQVCPSLDERVADGRVQVVLLKQVLAEMVVAVLRNPDGATYSSTLESEGPFSRQSTKTFSKPVGSTGAGQLELLPRHRRLLGLQAGMFTINLAPTACAPRPAFWL